MLAHLCRMVSVLNNVLKWILKSSLMCLVSVCFVFLFCFGCCFVFPNWTPTVLFLIKSDCKEQQTLPMQHLTQRLQNTHSPLISSWQLVWGTGQAHSLSLTAWADALEALPWDERLFTKPLCCKAISDQTSFGQAAVRPMAREKIRLWNNKCFMFHCYMGQCKAGETMHGPWSSYDKSPK